jgi:hypothetical protein
LIACEQAEAVMTETIDFGAGGYRYKDLLREGIVSSRGDLHTKQRQLAFPRPIKTGAKSAWFAKSEVHAWLAERARLRDRTRPVEPKPVHPAKRPRGRPRKATTETLQPST